LLEIFYPFDLAGELAEMMLGLVLLADVASRGAGSLSAAAPKASVGVALVLAGAVVTIPAVDALTLPRAMALLPAARAQPAEIGERLADPKTRRKKLFKKGRVHKRVFTAVRSGYLRLEEGHYLDAWNQPWWVDFHRTGAHEGKLLLYSFGPNRRRDTDLTRLARAERVEDVLEGDDLGVLLAVRTATTAP
jgi:hypothetical protein